MCANKFQILMAGILVAGGMFVNQGVVAMATETGASIANTAAATDSFARRFEAYRSALEAGQKAFYRKEYPAIIEQYGVAVALSPFESKSYLRRGIALYKSGREREAIPDFDKALLIEPMLVQALSYRGLCREKTADYVGALKDHTDALMATPSDPALHNNLAWLYVTAEDDKVRDPVRALEHARKAADMSKHANPEILDTLALALFRNGRRVEAIETEKMALKLAPGNDRFRKALSNYEADGPTTTPPREDTR